MSFGPILLMAFFLSLIRLWHGQDIGTAINLLFFLFGLCVIWGLVTS